MLFSFYLFLSSVSYFFAGAADQSAVEHYLNSAASAQSVPIRNWLGLVGAITAHHFLYEGFGVSGLLMLPILFLLGLKISVRGSFLPFSRLVLILLVFFVWTGLLIGYLSVRFDAAGTYFCGGVFYRLSFFLHILFGWGVLLLLLFSLFVFGIYYFGWQRAVVDWMKASFFKARGGGHRPDQVLPSPLPADPTDPAEEQEAPSLSAGEDDLNNDDTPYEDPVAEPAEAPPPKAADPEPAVRQGAPAASAAPPSEPAPPDPNAPTPYALPGLALLRSSDQEGQSVSSEELEEKKENIVKTLADFGIHIQSIRATVGPTVTLYEIVPKAGIRISKIKSLEDDIALSLAARGIRIIAPMPGKGTIGIEVPNKERELVRLRSVLSLPVFEGSTHELPVVIGKGISGEIVVADLAKMPHVLIAGATGQGKSVGLNVILLSLLYKKRPAELKLILVDPKKVELSLFSTIQRKFLAKLSSQQEAIITKKDEVVHTLQALCAEMDNRYEQLKGAGCRNIKEYNEKVRTGVISPQEGHIFLPYLVLVIDELADLMMTDGKSVETHIARLANLARAVGIHLVVATQRPSVDVITGVIKANFPARISYYVSSQVDSRTILDAKGAEQLVGAGDLLFSTGGKMSRLQCPYLDTQEVERVCAYIQAQPDKEAPYYLPEVAEERAPRPQKAGDQARDPLFEEAARLVVRHRIGSTSWLQRRMSIGFNRAGRLMDELEHAGVVGPQIGSKPREIRIADESELEDLLDSLDP